MLIPIARHFPMISGLYQCASRECENEWFVLSGAESSLAAAGKNTANFVKKAAAVSALGLIVLLSPILALADFPLGKIPKCRRMLYRIGNPRLEDCVRLFESDVSRSYLMQLKAFTGQEIAMSGLLSGLPERKGGLNPFQEEAGRFIRHLQSEPDTRPASRRAYYQKIMDHYRALLQLNEQGVDANDDLNREILTFLEKLAAWRYQSPVLWDEMIQYVRRDARVSMPEALGDPSAELPRVIERACMTIQDIPCYSGVRAQPGQLYDAVYFGDAPSVLFKMAPQRRTKIIRAPSLAREVRRNGRDHSLEKAEVTEEFRNYLKLLKGQGKSHLYINLMTRELFEEKMLAQAIEGLEQDGRLEGAIAVVSLDKNSPFYMQSDEFKCMDGSDTFIETFMVRMFGPGQKHFHWSKRLERSLWQTECRTILQKVHQTYFQCKPTLNHAERKDFIEIVYAKISEALIEKLQPETCNVSCRSCIDRGAAALALLYVDHLKKRGKALTPRKLEKIVALSCSPALLAMNRPIAPDRCLRLNTAAIRILTS